MLNRPACGSFGRTSREKTSIEALSRFSCVREEEDLRYKRFMQPVATKASTRRTWLKTALGASALAASGIVAITRTTGYALDPARAERLVVLAPWQFVVLEQLARRIVAPDDPEDRAIPTVEDVAVVEFIDGYLAEMRPSMRRDLLRMVQYLEHLAPLSSGYRQRFSALAPEEQDEVLRGVESSRIDLLRAGFEGLKSLVMMGFYRDARTWGIIGYAGPFVGRTSGAGKGAYP